MQGLTRVGLSDPAGRLGAVPDAATDESTLVVREALDATPGQVEIFRRYANASKCSYNFAYGVKHAAQQQWNRGRDALIAQGMSKEEANKKAPKVRIPGQFEIQKIFHATRDQPLPRREGEEEPRYLYRWWDGVNAMVCQQAFRDADRAWTNWKASHSGKRAGAPVGYPTPKVAGKCRESFRMFSVKLVDLRHIRVGGESRRGGQKAFQVRLCRPARRLAGLLQRGGVVKSVTIARSGHRWFVSFNVRMPQARRSEPTRVQRVAGRVGVDLGVAKVAATSRPVVVNDAALQLFDNPRHLENARRTLRRWERRMSRRYVKGKPARDQSRGWHEAKHHVIRLRALVAARRASSQHVMTKRIVTQYAEIALEDLKVKNMTRSAKGTTENPGRNVKAKSGLNRAVLDVGFAEIRRQIEYKAPWYGATVGLARPAGTSQTCHKCKHRDPKSRRSRSRFVCTRCGHTAHADINAAENIAEVADFPDAD